MSKGAAWLMLFSMVSKVIFPIIGIIITGQVGVKAVGTFGIAIALYTVTELFRDGGLAITYIADTEHQHGDERNYHGLAVMLGFFFALLTAVASGAVSRFYAVPEMSQALYWTATTMLIGSLASIPGSRLVKQARFREAGLADVVATGIGYSVALGLALTGFGLFALLIQMVLRGVVYLALVIRASGWIAPAFDLTVFGRLFRASFANLGANISYTVYTMADYAVIGKALGQSANGAYWVAFNIAAKPFDLITAPISRTMFVAFSRAVDQRDRQAHLFARTIAAVSLFAIPVYVLVGAHSNAIISILYPRGFEAAGPALGVLAYYLGFRSIGSAAGTALVACGRPGLHALSWLPGYAIAVAGIASVWANGTLIQFVEFLTYGAITVYVLNLLFAWATLRPNRQDAFMVGRSVASTLPAVGLVVAARWLPVAPWIQLLIGGGLAVILHLGVLAAIRLGNWRLGYSISGLKDIYRTL